MRCSRSTFARFALLALQCAACTALKDDIVNGADGGAQPDGSIPADSGTTADANAAADSGTAPDADAAPDSGSSPDAASGSVDESFGDHGWLYVPMSTDTLPRAMALIPPAASSYPGDVLLLGTDAKFTGPGVIVRLTPNALHESPGASPSVKSFDLGHAYQDYTSMARDSQGRVIVGGFYSDDSSGAVTHGSIARFLPGGARDSPFGAQGVIAVGHDVQGVAILANDDIVAVGRDIDANGIARAFVAKLSAADGHLDPAFGGTHNPMLLPTSGTPGSEHALATSIALDGSRLVIAGAAQCASADVVWWQCHPFVARLGADGQLDPTFGSPGAGARTGIATPSSDIGRFDDVAIDLQGRTNVAGHLWAAGGARCVVARLDTHGDGDPGFGTQGVAKVDMAFNASTDDQRCNAILPEPGGAVTLAGSTFSGNDAGTSFTNTVVTRLDDKGAVDPKFAQDGRLSFTYYRALGTGATPRLTHAADGSLLVLAGARDAIDQGNLAVVRLTP